MIGGLLGMFDDPEKLDQLALAMGLLGGKKGENPGIHFQRAAQAKMMREQQKQARAMQDEQMQMRREDQGFQRQQFERQGQQFAQQQAQLQQRQAQLAQLKQQFPHLAPMIDLNPDEALKRAFPEQKMQFAPDGRAVDLSQVRHGESFAPPEKPDIRFAPNGQVVDMRNVKPGTSFAPPREPKAEPPGQYDASRGVIIDPRTGQARPVTMPDGSPLAPKDAGKPDKPLTEGQAKGSLYFGMMKDAEDSLSSIKNFDVTKGDNQTLIAFARGDIKKLPGALQNTAAGADAQRYVQGSYMWSEAMLRQLTGAAAPPEEIKRNAATYFPQFGDRPEQIAQKNAARKQVTEYLRIIAGPGADQVDAVRAARKPTAEDPLGIR